MYIHCFAFRWKPEVTEEQIDRVAAAIQKFDGQIPGLLETYVGRNESPRSEGYAFGGVMKFTDKASYQAYNSHPAHQELLSWLLPLIDPMEMDFAV